ASLSSSPVRVNHGWKSEREAPTEDP
ncbi:hypothetical protein TNIN_475051, partial [Trichonephila inaurata madagascariensis]